MVMNKKPPRVCLMEKLRNKKILSERSNVPCSLYLRPGDCISSGEKVDDCSTKHSSYSPTINGSANTFLRTPGTLKTTLVEDHHVPLGNETCLTPKGEAVATLNGDPIPGQVTPIDFSVLSAADFGIAPESSTQQQKGDSKSLLKKYRRRSTIGARGSPENNSLIQYIACQKSTRMEKPSQVSPFKHHSVLLKDKIAAFQSSFKPLEETEERLNHTHTASKNGGAGPHEQSMFGQGWHLESRSFAVEEHLNSQSVSGERISADLPVRNIVYPLQEPLVFGTYFRNQEKIPEKGSPSEVSTIQKSGIQSQCIDEELSSSSASQQSIKKVRFAEKESLEIFDESKPPITPLQKGQFPSGVLHHNGACLRSVLKKPPEHFDDSSSREQSEALLAKTCELQQIESNTGPVNETEEDCKDLDTNVLATLPLVCTPLLRGAGPSGSRNYSAITPIKQPLPQPNFDSEDDLPPASLTVEHITECAVNSDLEETNSSSDLQATCFRITRSSRKRKLVRSAETDIHLPTEGQSKSAPTKKVCKSNKVEKAKSKKTPASRRKVFGKRRRQKKEQKALYGQRETVSKKPLLSPIPEMKEDLSFASYRSTPRSQISILDYSDSNDACVEYMDKKARKENGALQIPTMVSSGLNLSLDLVKENALPDIKLISSQLQDGIMTAGENRFPWDPPEKDSPAGLKSTINKNQQTLESDCSSNETKMLKELEFLGADATDKKNASRGELALAGDSALEVTNEGEVNRNFKRFPRRSRRFSHYLPSIGDHHSKTFGHNSCVPRSPLEELLPTQTVNDSALLNDLQHSIEESFRYIPCNDQKRVRRSMRRLKDAENTGLVWVNIPADSITNTILGCANNKAQSQMCPSSLEELERLCQKEDGFHVLLPMKEEKDNLPVVMGPCRSKAGWRRRSFCALGLEENQNVVLPPRRNRRASIGYRSDQCYRQDSEMRKHLVNQPTILI